MQLDQPQPAVILYLHGSADLYGADRTLLQLVSGLDRSCYRAVVALPKHGPLVAALTTAGATVEIGPLGVGCRASMSICGIGRLLIDIPRAIGFVRGLVAKHKPKVIHTNTIVVLGGALGAWTTRIPHLWHVHEILAKNSSLSRFFTRTLQVLSHIAVSNSRCTRASFAGANLTDASLSNYRAHDHRVIHNGSPRGPAKKDQNPSSHPTVLLMGRINSWKGQELLLSAAAALRDKHPAARYRIVGDAPSGQVHFEHELDHRIAQAGLGDIVTRAGFVTDPTAEYLNADIVVVPSTRPEPFGLVAIEAMSFGLPVIAANHGGLPEIVKHGETGRLFTPGSSNDLTRQLELLLSDPWLARDLGASGRARQASHFSLERYCVEFTDIYEQLQAA